MIVVIPQGKERYSPFYNVASQPAIRVAGTHKKVVTLDFYKRSQFFVS